MSKFRLEERTVIVTGGAGGLGAAMAKACAEAGANVVVASRNKENIDRVAEEITGDGQTAIALPVDITDASQLDDMIAQSVEAFGSVDVIVNSAGRWGKSHLAEDTPLDEWQQVIELNLTGCFLSCLAAGKQMIKQNHGKIINISSTAGSKGNPGQLHYSAAKAGVLSLTNNLAFMWAKHNINVNCILPGLIATEELKGYNIIPPSVDEDGVAVPRLELPPNPEDVANLVLFLASAESDGITGELIPIRTWLKTERFWQ